MFTVQMVGARSCVYELAGIYLGLSLRSGLGNPHKVSTLRVASPVPDAMVSPKGY